MGHLLQLQVEGGETAAVGGAGGGSGVVVVAVVWLGSWL